MAGVPTYGWPDKQPMTFGKLAGKVCRTSSESISLLDAGIDAKIASRSSR